MISYTVSEVAAHLEGHVTGDTAIVLTGFAAAEDARQGDLTFAENAKFFAHADQSAASAILVDGDQVSAAKAVIHVTNARIACAKVLPLFFPEPQPAVGIHPTAVVEATAKIDPTASVGPHCVIGAGVMIGARTVLLGGNHVAAQCVIGDDTRLFPNAVLYARTQIGNRVRIHAGAVIGADGFGYVFDHGAHLKIPQVGCVIVADDVEIGANTTIDRGALGSTFIGKGTKIDNLVQVAHNVVTGEHCILVAQVGIAGSTKLGDHVILAGQVGVNGHIKIGNRVIVGGGSGVHRDIPDGERWMGSPALPERQSKRMLLSTQHLPELLRRVRRLEERLANQPGSATPSDSVE